jgi:photoactive yellow protein
MASDSLDFDAPDLAARIEQLSQYELDHLSFGVILLDRDNTVMFYSETEARLSGSPAAMIGQNFFAVAKRMAGDDFRGRIDRARETGKVDLEFGWVGDFNDPKRDMRVRIQSAHTGGVWIFIERDVASRAR